MSMYQGKNPKALLSEKLLIEALLNLMEQKIYNEINIKEICQIADISRQTFYKLFKTKDELLEYVIDSVFKEIVKEISTNAPVDTITTTAVFVRVFYANKRLMDLIIKNNLETIFVKKFMQAITGITFIVDPKSKISNLDYIFAYYSGGLTNILIHWSQDPDRIPPEELSKLISNIINSELK
jgi:AcrR family transcriptional regulator